MTKEQFKYLFSEEVGANGFYLVPDVFVFRDPLSVWDSNTNEEAVFDSIDELWEYEYAGKKVGDYIADMQDLIVRLNGSTGGNESTFKFSHADDSGNGPDESATLLPAYANVRIKSKTLA